MSCSPLSPRTPYNVQVHRREYYALISHMDAQIGRVLTALENFFAKLKQFRALATRFDKTARNFLAATYFVSAVIWLD